MSKYLNIKIFKKPFFVAALGILTFFPHLVFAQGKLAALFDKVGGLARLFITFLFVLATALFLWGIIKYIIAMQGEGDATEAKKYMAWGIISLFIIVAFWGIVFIVARTLFG